MISIIDYGAGNLTSVKRALDYLKIPSVVTRNRDEISNAERIVFPGVGHARSAMEVLRQRGFDSAIKAAFEKGIPILGICLGTQIILSYSEEGDTECLGLISGVCPKFNFTDKSLKIPHMGWNAVAVKREHFVFNDIRQNDEFYFVHSYYPKPQNPDAVYAVATYGISFAAAIGYKNLFATQFHPEKSGPVGLQILKNFSQWDGTAC